jgi:hypothetical protein
LQNQFKFIATLGVVTVLLLSVSNSAAAQTIFKDSYEQVAAITSFSASADAINQGESTTISWTTVGASACSPSGGAGDWAATVIDLPDGSAQIQINDSGNFTFTLTCVGIFGSQAFGNLAVSVSPVPAEITSFLASPDAIAEGDITTLSWTTKFATSCTPTGGAGGWDEQSIDPSGGNTPITIPTAGEYTFTLTCAGDTGAPAVAEEIVTVSPAAVITSFTATPDSLVVDNSTVLSWTTENATSCTPSGGLGGWDAVIIEVPDGETSIVIDSDGEHTFTLTCNGVAGPAAVAEVTVAATFNPNECPAPPLANGSLGFWKNFWLEDFPLPESDSRFLTIPRKGYYALEFNTGNFVDDGKMTTIETTVTDGVRLGSFSTCPGDFDVPTECQHSWGQGGGVRWATNGRSGACQLELNTTYYFNVTYTDGATAGSTTCDSSPCITNMQHSNPE